MNAALLSCVLMRVPRVPAQRRFVALGSGLVPVPADQRESIARILQEYAPHAAPTVDWAQNSV
jgi:hypothetical protein